MIDTSELADIPAGPELSAALARIDPAMLCGFDLVELLRARNRQVSYEQAQLLRAVRELAYTPPDMSPVVRRAGNVDGYVFAEVAFALSWTRNKADYEVGLALDLVDNVPVVFDALAAGVIDIGKARVFSRELQFMEEASARRVAGRLLADRDGRAPEAARCTTGQLGARLRRLVLAVDPDAVRTRHAKAVADRGLHHAESANGTSVLSGYHLPKDKAAAAWEHVDAIARASKTAGGEERTLDQLRADIFADLLAGVDPAAAGYATPARRRGVIHVHVGLSTLAGLSDRPGEIDGFGPVLADIARQAAAQMADRAQWRFTVTDPHGTPVAEGRLSRPATRAAVAAGRLRYRPTAAQAHFVRARDITCRGPGCRRPAVRCDLDHVHDWDWGGPTIVDNLCCLCRPCHRLKHEGGFDIVRTSLGFAWTTPRGHRYTVLPEVIPPPRRVEHIIVDLIHHQGPSHLRR